MGSALRAQGVRESVHAACELFWASRIVLLVLACFVFPTSGGIDVPMYADYAHAHLLATQQGQTVFQLRDVEYPPLSTLSIILPGYLAAGDSVGETMSPEFLSRYRSFFRLQMALYDVICFACLTALIRRCFPQESTGEQSLRLLTYVAGGVLLGSIVYARLDLTVAALIACGLLLATGRLHYVGSFALLAAGIAFKLVPIVLTPVFVAASLPVAALVNLHNLSAWPRFAGILVQRLIVLAALLALLCVPFYAIGGDDVFACVAYHKTRGIEIGSLYATMIGWADRFGVPLTVYSSHKCFNVRNAFSDGLSRHVPLILGTGLMLSTVLFAIRLQHTVRRTSTREEDSLPVGAVYRKELIAGTLLLLWTFILLNKVLSPQYLIWMLPLVPLVSSTNRGNVFYLAVFLLACSLTTLVAPVFWESQILGASFRSGSRLAWSGPTPFGWLLLSARNLCLVVLLVATVACLRRGFDNAAPRRAAGESLPVAELAKSSDAT